MWQCKLCKKVVSSRALLLKHYRLVHSRQQYPCAYSDCVCVFKTWNALHSHLSRSHTQRTLDKSVSLATFNCHLCSCCNIASEQEYFSHINNHLKCNETVHCMFEGCSFKTNIYGTFKSHRNRKHNPYTLKDFKIGIANTIVGQTSADDSTDTIVEEDISANIDHDTTIFIIKTGVPETSTGSNESSVSSFNLGSPCSGHNPDYDTDILSSPESRSSSSSSSANSTLRSEAWPLDFRIPEFSFDVELQLTKGNQEFQANGTLLTLKPKLKSDILESLSSEIMKYKAYPSDSNLSDVCQALVVKHPCLKEKGSETGFSAWKISLKYKMSNYRGKLKNLGCSELVINSLKRRGNSNVHPNQVKKPRRAEVNFCPDYPAGETRESQEEERLVLLSEFKKKNNDETIKAKMAQTFPHRRQEILQDMPFVADFKSRWPALFSPREVTESVDLQMHSTCNILNPSC
uniref:C2H2-type domain-containing protein n=1 Tax=Oreochromis niloticus TaxID=8128 RepID=A0A669BXH9_ORENI